MQKQAPCCARLTAKLHHDENNLRSLAKKAARHMSKGWSVERYKDLITGVKETIIVDKQQIADHEAEHAQDAA